MANKNGFYSVEEYRKQKHQQGNAAKIPPKANLLAAASHVRNIFEGKKLVYGVFGGLSMLCLGYRREQPDLHIVYDDRDFHRLKAKLESDPRIRLPHGMNSLFPAKILVRTGPFYKDAGCTRSAEIEVDLVPPGSHGTPVNGSLSNNLVLLSLPKAEEGKLKTFKGLNMLYILKTSIHYAGVRELGWDPRKDILFLCQHYGREVQGARSSLDQKAIKQNFLGTALFSRLSPSDQRLCYQVLLGTEPPPTMALTPPTLPAHKHSSSDPKPRMVAHKSNPSLNAAPSTGLLSLPAQGKTAHKRSVSADIKPSELSVAGETQPYAGVPAHAASRESRSRYRPISNSGSREHSPRAEQSPLGIGMAAVQQRANQLPQLQSNLAPTPSSLSPRRSMPNMNAGLHGVISPYAFSQTPSSYGLAVRGQYQNQSSMPLVEMSATPTPINPGQHHLLSQVGLAGASIAHHGIAQRVPITERPPPPHTRGSYQGPAVFRAELSAAPSVVSYTKQTDLEMTPTDGGPRCQPHGQNSFTQPPVELSAEECVSPEQAHSHSNQHPPTRAAELEAVSPLGSFIAELSVDRATPAPSQPTTQEPQPRPTPCANNNPHSTYTDNDSPVSPPDHHAIPAIEPSNPFTVRPLNPRTQSAPLTALPTSLMAGRPNPHHRTPSGASSSSTSLPAPTSVDLTALQTNASRYSRYYSSASSSSSSQPHPLQTHSSPAVPTTSQYQAYHPTAVSSHPHPDHTQQHAPDTTADDTPTTATPTQPLNFQALRDVDGKNHYFTAAAQHKREKSHDSTHSDTSHDSGRLADEYRAALPDFEGGYAGGGR